jgi:uncharacterized protein (DUF362 family)/ferredoxin
MEKAKVSIVRLEDYEKENVYKAVQQSLDLLGGLENIFKPRSQVFVKINHLSLPSSPDKGIITHPALTREILLLLKELGHKIIIGDDIQSKEEDGFLISGYRQICEELEVPLVNLKEKGFQKVNCNGKVLEKVYVSPVCLEADYILNLPKLKTHSFTAYTGAVKNMFGIIPHGLRHNFHRRYSKSDQFCQMLVDIFSCAPPHLTIMDAVIAMEGEGPSAGNLRIIGVILASQDAVALDAAAAKIVGFRPMDIYTTLHAHEQGLGKGKIEEIEVVGEEIHDVLVQNFKHSAFAGGLLQRTLPSLLHGYIQDQMSLIPEVIREKCTACLECIKDCPAKAVKFFEDLAWIDKKACIHCMCCHEVCRYYAIKLKRHPVAKMVSGAETVYKKIKALFGKKLLSHPE